MLVREGPLEAAVSHIPIREKRRLEGSEKLGFRPWTEKTDALVRSKTTQAIFIERCLKIVVVVL